MVQAPQNNAQIERAGEYRMFAAGNVVDEVLRRRDDDGEDELEPRNVVPLHPRLNELNEEFGRRNDNGPFQMLKDVHDQCMQQLTNNARALQAMIATELNVKMNLAFLCIVIPILMTYGGDMDPIVAIALYVNMLCALVVVGFNYELANPFFVLYVFHVLSFMALVITPMCIVRPCNILVRTATIAAFVKRVDELGLQKKHQ